jgi:cell division protein FtsB
MRRELADAPEDSVSGWISLSDVFLTSTVFLLGALLSIAAFVGTPSEDGDKLFVPYKQLREDYASLQRQFGELTKEVASLRAERLKLEADLERSRLDNAELAKQMEDERRKHEDAIGESQRLLGERDRKIQELESEVARLSSELERVTRSRSQQENRESRIRQDLVGIQGSLTRTVFVFDRSFSMKSGGRWTFVKETAQKWLDLLPVEEAALVTFGDDVTVYPRDGRTLLDTA